MVGPKPILFLDMDGTVILGPKELGRYSKGPQDVELFEGVLEKIKLYKEQGWRIVLISNQGGIALGHIDESTVARIMNEVSRLCANLFDRIVWCPHHPDILKTEPDAMEMAECFCRKPRPGLVFATMASLTEQFPNEYFRPSAALFVGDMDTDKACADACGMPFKWAKDWREM